MTRDDKTLIEDPHMDRLGPMPCQALAALSDLGLTTGELARYFAVNPDTIAALTGSAPTQGRQRTVKAT